MDNSKRTFLLFLFWITIFSTHIIFTCADQSQNNQEKPSPQEILFNTYTLFTKVSLQYWESVKSLINQAQLKFSPPDLDFRSKDDVNLGGGQEGQVGAKERVKDAAEKSFEKSKEAVQESAKTAADVVGEAVHETAEKVKDKMPGKDGVHEEL